MCCIISIGEPEKGEDGSLGHWVGVDVQIKVEDFCLTLDNRVWLIEKSSHSLYSGEWEPDQAKLKLRSTSQRADQILASPNGAIVWRLHQGRLLVLYQKSSDNWMEIIDSNVLRLALNDTMGFILTTDGQLRAQVGLSASNPFSDDKPAEHLDCPRKFRDLVCTNQMLLGITEEGQVLARNEMSPEHNPLGSSWAAIPSLKRLPAVKAVSLREYACPSGPPNYAALVVTTSGQVFYTQAGKETLLLVERLLWYQITQLPSSSLVKLEPGGAMWVVSSAKDSCLRVNARGAIKASVWKMLDFTVSAENQGQHQRVKEINANSLYGNEGRNNFVP